MIELGARADNIRDHHTGRERVKRNRDMGSKKKSLKREANRMRAIGF